MANAQQHCALLHPLVSGLPEFDDPLWADSFLCVVRGSVRNANTCFILDGGGGCLLMHDIDTWCAAVGENRNCRSGNTYVEQVSTGSLGISQQSWYNYNVLPQIYRTESNPGNLVFNVSYLYDPVTVSLTSQPQQITYNTQIGVHYHIHTGLFDLAGEPKYFLMGVGSSGFSETLSEAFNRHWNRLNRDRTPENPETYRPGSCVYAMAHVLSLIHI